MKVPTADELLHLVVVDSRAVHILCVLILGCLIKKLRLLAFLAISFIALFSFG